MDIKKIKYLACYKLNKIEIYNSIFFDRSFLKKCKLYKIERLVYPIFYFDL